MKVRGKKLTALLLAVCMLLGLAACGGGGKSDDTQQLSGTVYVPEFIDIDLDIDYINSGCSDGKYIYIVTEVASAKLVDENWEEIRDMTDEESDRYEKDGTVPEDGAYVNYDYRNAIFRVSLDGQEVTELENYQPTPLPEGMEGSVNINSIRLGAEGTLWVTEYMYTYSFDLPEDFDPENDDQWNYYTEGENVELQRQLDSTGNELSRIETSGLAEKLDADYLNSTVIDADGNFFATCSKYTESSDETKIAVLDKDLNLLFEVKGENLWGQMVLLGDGSVGIITNYSDPETNTYKQVLKTIDMAAKDWGTEYTLPSNAYTAYTGNEQYLFYYDNNDSLYGYNKETGEGEKILSWSSADINKNNLMFFSFLSDGRIVTMSRDWNSGGSEMEIAVLSEQPASVLGDKTILTYACMYLDYDVRAKIIDFNKTNSKYRIEVRDYSEYNTDDDYSAGLTKLNTEIVAGKVPDILATGNMPIRQYGAKGVLEDLWPYIESDPDLGREALMENVFKAAEQDGKLYQIFSNFSIQTVGGAPSVVGDRMSWTMADMQEALASMPEGCQYFDEGNTKSGMLSTILQQNLNSYVDWTTGECYFNTDEFISMLEFCNSFPLEYDWENVDWEEQEDMPTRIQNGKQMLTQIYLYDFQSIQMYKAMFGGELSFVGYPREDGSVGSTFSIGSGMAMSSTCKDKEGAWSFMRQLLLPQDTDDDYYYYGNFPTNKADFDKLVERNMKVEYELDENGQPVLDENGNPIEVSQGGWGLGSQEIEIHATTQEEYDQIMDLYNAIDSISGYDEKLFSIISETAESYFNGDKDVKQAADEIQNRVKLYVNENR